MYERSANKQATHGGICICNTYANTAEAMRQIKEEKNLLGKQEHVVVVVVEIPSILPAGTLAWKLMYSITKTTSRSPGETMLYVSV